MNVIAWLIFVAAAILEVGAWHSSWRGSWR